MLDSNKWREMKLNERFSCKSLLIQFSSLSSRSIFDLILLSSLSRIGMSDLLMLTSLDMLPWFGTFFIVSSIAMQSMPSECLHLTSVSSFIVRALLFKCSLITADCSSRTFPSANECSRGSPSCWSSIGKTSLLMPNRTADSKRNRTHKYADLESSIEPKMSNFLPSIASSDKIVFTTCDAKAFSLTLLNPHKFEWMLARM